MGLTIHPDAPPLRVDQYGVCRVSGGRVTLEVILEACRQGETPEQLAESFPTIPLADVYAVIGYYLKHRDEVDAYLVDAERAAASIRAEIETGFPATELRTRIRSRRRPVSA